MASHPPRPAARPGLVTSRTDVPVDLGHDDAVCQAFAVGARLDLAGGEVPAALLVGLSLGHPCGPKAGFRHCDWPAQ